MISRANDRPTRICPLLIAMISVGPREFKKLNRPHEFFFILIYGTRPSPDHRLPLN
jgi:hypothetical protein